MARANITPEASHALQLFSTCFCCTFADQRFPSTLHGTLHNAHYSPLLQLPPELRNEIWKYVCTDRTYGFKRRDFMKGIVDKKVKVQRIWPCWSGLLRTCRQINSEAALLPVQLNVVQVDSSESLNRLLHNLSMARQPIISLRLRVRRHNDSRLYKSRFTIQRQLPHAKTVYVTVFGPPRQLVRYGWSSLTAVAVSDDVQQTLALYLGGGGVDVVFV
jgi:hypothetical protein